jgi:hypothetical protein
MRDNHPLGSTGLYLCDLFAHDPQVSCGIKDRPMPARPGSEQKWYNGLGETRARCQSADMSLRYVIRPDRQGFSVCDLWTGQPAVLAMDPQTGLSEEDAEHLAELLNKRALQGDRTVLS